MSKLEVVEEKPGLQPEKIKELVARDKADRIARVKVRIDAILVEERCQMLPMMILTPGNITARLEIQALD
jgi:hypothetical protein